MKDRQEKIFSIISRQPEVSVKELSVILGVSEVTIRKDLAQLEDEGVLKRIHGGAVQLSSDSIEKRMLFRYKEKLKIAQEAVKLVNDGDTILVEAGSTNAVFAKELATCRKVHIITNSLYIPRILKEYHNVQVTVTGGNLQNESEAMVGPIAKTALSGIFVNKAFLGMDGFSESLGFTCGDFLRAEIGNVMGHRAEKIIVLAEASKFENTGLTSVVELSRVDTVITDRNISNDKLKILKKHNINTVIV
ncbi:MAG: sugar metabolism transcriptional regulator [Eubacterium sp.]|nr:sugar metabolism transcriptional regulator [Eubacterium sp.]